MKRKTKRDARGLDPEQQSNKKKQSLACCFSPSGVCINNVVMVVFRISCVCVCLCVCVFVCLCLFVCSVACCFVPTAVAAVSAAVALLLERVYSNHRSNVCKI